MIVRNIVSSNFNVGGIKGDPLIEKISCEYDKDFLKSVIIHAAIDDSNNGLQNYNFFWNFDKNNRQDVEKDCFLCF